MLILSCTKLSFSRRQAGVLCPWGLRYAQEESWWRKTREWETERPPLRTTTCRSWWLNVTGSSRRWWVGRMILKPLPGTDGQWHSGSCHTELGRTRGKASPPWTVTSHWCQGTLQGRDCSLGLLQFPSTFLDEENNIQFVSLIKPLISSDT